MKTMTLYRMETVDKGNRFSIGPKVPLNTIDNMEDEITPRICVSPTIIGCIKSLELTYDDRLKTYDEDSRLGPTEGFKVYLYQTIAPVEYICQPTVESVPDCWLTGELWLIERSFIFTKVCSMNVRRAGHLAGSSYSRYTFTRDGCDEVVDKQYGTVIYGEPEAFSMMEYDAQSNSFYYDRTVFFDYYDSGLELDDAKEENNE